MDLGLRGKAALISGASEGIGKHCALALAAEGADVAICARRPDLLEAARTEIEAAGPGRAVAVVADVAQGEDVERVVAETVASFDGLDILINNVGVSAPGDEDDVWQRMFEVNLLATVRMTRVALPHLRARAQRPNADSSVILHIGSIFGREAGGISSYNAMKAGVHSHAKAMALALAKDNIRVNSIAPGSIAWPGSRWEQRYKADPETIQRTIVDTIAMGRFGRPEAVAQVVTFLASPRAEWVTGVCLNVDGGQTRSII